MHKKEMTSVESVWVVMTEYTKQAELLSNIESS